jgi:hypothetical protein
MSLGKRPREEEELLNALDLQPEMPHTWVSSLAATPAHCAPRLASTPSRLPNAAPSAAPTPPKERSDTPAPCAPCTPLPKSTDPTEDWAPDKFPGVRIFLANLQLRGDGLTKTAKMKLQWATLFHELKTCLAIDTANWEKGIFRKGAEEAFKLVTPKYKAVEQQLKETQQQLEAERALTKKYTEEATVMKAFLNERGIQDPTDTAAEDTGEISLDAILNSMEDSPLVDPTSSPLSQPPMSPLSDTSSTVTLEDYSRTGVFFSMGEIEELLMADSAAV